MVSAPFLLAPLKIKLKLADLTRAIR